MPARVGVGQQAVPGAVSGTAGEFGAVWPDKKRIHLSRPSLHAGGAA